MIFVYLVGGGVKEVWEDVYVFIFKYNIFVKLKKFSSKRIILFF